MCTRPGDRTKIMAIVPGFRLLIMVKLQFFVFNLFITCTGQTGRPTLTPNASKDAVPPKECFFGVTMKINFIKGSILCQLSKKNHIGLAGSQKTHVRFRQLPDITQITRPAIGKTINTEKFAGTYSNGFKFSKTSPQWRNPSQMSLYHHSAKS
jgi:hypothetical protein